LKVAVSEDVQTVLMKEFKFWGMGFSEDTNGKCLRDARPVSMKVQTIQQNAFCRNVD
jgi:hypothetical protein